MKTVAHFLASVAAAVVMLAAVALLSAQYAGDGIYGGGGGGGVSSALVCLLSGGTGCTMTGDITMSSDAKVTYQSDSTGGIFINNAATTYIQAGSAGSTYFRVDKNEPRVESLNAASIQTAAFFSAAPANLTVTASASPTATFLRLSSTGAVNWTPGAPGAAMGAMVSACNVDAESDVITMTDGTTYEGSGCALGINDCVTFIYDTTTTKWRETSCNNN